MCKEVVGDRVKVIFLKCGKNKRNTYIDLYTHIYIYIYTYLTYIHKFESNSCTFIEMSPISGGDIRI